MKRIIPILSFILLTAMYSEAQIARTSPVAETSVKVRLYPNPATTYITFELGAGYEKGLSIQVYSFIGRKMYELPNVGEKTTLDLSEYNRGVYIYHIKEQSGKTIESGKFQVSK